jgi:chromosome segregation ATPase
MPTNLTRQLSPEEEELQRKREELTAIRAILADRELEFADFRNQLAAFEGRYLRQVGALYAELDHWKARISELQVQFNPSKEAKTRAEEARKQASGTYEEAHGKAAETRDFTPSPELRSLFREVAKRLHPDLSRDGNDLNRRTRFMAQANCAYEEGDAEALKRILDEYQDGVEEIRDDGVGAELIRIIRQISAVRDRLSFIEREVAVLKQSEIALLEKRTDERERDGGDLLAELEEKVRKDIEAAQAEYEALANEWQPA